MQPHVRLAAAAIALSHATGKDVSSVYDYSQGKYLSIDASVKEDRVAAYDYGQRCHIDGSLPSLYHYGAGRALDLKTDKPAHYSGYDYDSSCHFEINIKGSNAEFYDYGEGKWFSFSV
jgi:hypothetical protein